MTRSDYIRRAKRGGRIHFEYENRDGTITGYREQYLLVRLDGDKHPSLLHPSWKVRYLDGGEPR